MERHVRVNGVVKMLERTLSIGRLAREAARHGRPENGSGHSGADCSKRPHLVPLTRISGNDCKKPDTRNGETRAPEIATSPNGFLAA